jgi:hypothetical protein
MMREESLNDYASLILRCVFPHFETCCRRYENRKISPPTSRGFEWLASLGSVAR